MTQFFSSPVADTSGSVPSRIFQRRVSRVSRGPAFVVDEKACIACGACLLTCPPRALMAERSRVWVRKDRCTSCWGCAEICPVDAIGPIDVTTPVSAGLDVTQ